MRETNTISQILEQIGNWKSKMCCILKRTFTHAVVKSSAAKEILEESAHDNFLTQAFIYR